jgi:hypothetical protein
MSRRARVWLLALLTAAATSVATLLATAAQAGIQGSGSRTDPVPYPCSAGPRVSVRWHSV